LIHYPHPNSALTWTVTLFGIAVWLAAIIVCVRSTHLSPRAKNAWLAFIVVASILAEHWAFPVAAAVFLMSSARRRTDHELINKDRFTGG
jgi:hypothetical protein